MELTTGLYVHMFSIIFRPLAQIPQYSDKDGFAPSKDNKNTPFPRAFGVENTAPRSFLIANRKQARSLPALSSIRGQCILWGESMTWGRRNQPLRRLLVDIGGGFGFAVKGILRNSSVIPTDDCFIVELA